ncbi:MAG TPA: acetylxylan esterase [Terriglobia bacterium]|nr:acetylxylan esterase [Terriglobia bacterium]
MLQRIQIRRRAAKISGGKGRIVWMALALPVCLAWIPATAAAQRNREVQEARSKAFYQYLEERGAEISRRTLSNVQSLQQLEKLKPELRRELAYMVGLDPTPARTPLHVEITGTLERDGVRIEKVVYQSMPGLYVTGNLYMPSQGRKPFPVVLYLCGHLPDPYGAKVPYQRHGIWFAQHGYVCLVLDTLEFGEVPGIHHGLYDQNMWQWLSLGYTPVGVEVWNAMRGLDYLETLPDVDMKRVALTGESGGGSITWYTAALDKRIAVAVPAISTWTAGTQVALHGVQENCDCIYFPNIYEQDFTVLGALIAPRPLKMISARLDPMFPPAGYNAVYEKLKPIYALYGAEDKVAAFDQEAHHGDNVPLRRESATWIQRWLRGDMTPYDDGAFTPIPGSQLECLMKQPKDAVNYGIYNHFVPVAPIRNYTSVPAWNARRKQVLAGVKSKVFRAFPQSPVALDAQVKPIEWSWANKYTDVFSVTFTTERNLQVRGILYKPKGPEKPRRALIYVKGRHDDISVVDFDKLLPLFGRYEILVLQPRATDFAISDQDWITYERTAEILGSTVESMQVWDIMRAVQFMTADEKVEPGSISLYGRGDMGILALYAAILDSRPGCVVLDHPPATHWNGPPLLDVLRVTDIPEAAALFAPHELVLLQPTGHGFDHTAALYRLTGNANKFQEARSLPAALKVWEQQRSPEGLD